MKFDRRVNADETYAVTALFGGTNNQWAASVEAPRIGPQNFAKLVNMRYAPGGGVKAVSGFSRINFQPLSTGLEDFAADYSETDTAADRLAVS